MRTLSHMHVQVRTAHKHACRHTQTRAHADARIVIRAHRHAHARTHAQAHAHIGWLCQDTASCAYHRRAWRRVECVLCVRAVKAVCVARGRTRNQLPSSCPCLSLWPLAHGTAAELGRWRTGVCFRVGLDALCYDSAVTKTSPLCLLCWKRLCFSKIKTPYVARF